MGLLVGLFWVESPKQISVRLVCLQTFFCCFFLYFDFSYGLVESSLFPGCRWHQRAFADGMSLFLSFFSPIFPFAILSMACIYAWFSSLPASFLSIDSCGEPWRLQKLLKTGSGSASPPTPLFLCPLSLHWSKIRSPLSVLNEQL